MLQKASFILSHILYHYFYFLYKPLYFGFKNRQDKEEIALFTRLIKSGDNVLDIGANIGFCTRIFSKCAGQKGHVYAFEPDELNYSRLIKNTEDRTNVTLIKAAVAENDGTQDFYHSSFLNVDHRAYPFEDAKDKVTVKSISIDQYFKDAKTEINFIKVDVQGFEMQVFAGMKQILKDPNSFYIFTELFPNGLNRAGSSADALIGFFRSMEYSIYSIKEGKLIPFDDKKLQEYKTYKKYEFDNVLITRNTIN